MMPWHICLISYMLAILFGQSLIVSHVYAYLLLFLNRHVFLFDPSK